MGFLWYRRDTPLLKIRGLSLSFAAIAFLHTYWMVVQMAYIANPFPQQAEYWIMGIYLPFGIALFHASNTRFLYIARQQRRSRLGRLSHTRKMLVVIGTGMVLQLILTVIMYLLSRKFHPSFGVPGTEVALDHLAILLVVDSSTCGTVAGKTDTRFSGMEDPDSSLLHCRTISAVEKASTVDSVGTAYSGESMLSMGALEYVLERNPDRLRQFSALNDFSGENVAFLTAVAEWRTRYRTVGKGEAAREAYNKALHIYADFISPKDAEFPINISFQVKTGLEAMFEKAARVLYGERGLANSPATPFAPGADWPRGEPAAARPSHASERPMIGSRSNSDADVELRALTDRVAFWGDVPAEFDATVFDKAETSIKYLVLTNTWPKFGLICVACIKDFIM
ncbi:hypothetical protein UCDDA912_g02007 [Diaporthe ampelina]|uniref:Uncharacterized protein n=1 Tax=Diaporthe ampelina TaxID=1214573 RepID=A0A0G2HT34_9PEZI|nr:hypothetical protein UCDDA912_g02007 [Diaporthe ampelina]